MAEKKRRRLDIIASDTVVASGTNNKTGKPWTIYEVSARNPDTGIEINQPLRSFSRLELGVGEYDVEPYTREGYPTTYNVSAPNSKGGGALKASVDGLRERITLVEQNVETIRANLANLTHLVEELRSGQTPVAAGDRRPPPPDDDDIPF